MDLSQNENIRDKDFRLAGVLRRMADVKKRRNVAKAQDDSPEPLARVVSKPVKTAQALKAQARQELAAAEAELTSADRWPLPGLAPMTRVSTSFGEVHAIALRKGDLVETRDGEFRPIVWLNRIMLDQAFLNSKPDSNPVEIRAGAVANGVPKADIMVSPRQVLCPSKASGLPPSVEAGALKSRAGVSRRKETGLSYTMFHLGAPADVLCEGVYLRFVPET